MRKSTSYRDPSLILMTIGAFFLPIKLSFAYTILIPLIIYTLFLSWKTQELKGMLSNYLWLPLLTFFAVAATTSLLGLNPLKSVSNALSASFMTLLIPTFARTSSEHKVSIVLTGLVAGQTVAGIHSIIAMILPHFMPRFFVGEVTESGQIGLTLFIALGLIKFFELREEERTQTSHKRLWLKLASLASCLVILTICFIVPIYYPYNSLGIQLTLFLGIFFATLVTTISILKRQYVGNIANIFLLTIISLPVLISTLLLNLKRGPWAGSLIGVSIFFACYRPRIILPLFAGTIIAFATITPLSERLVSARDHFYIAGGRSEIWDIGREMIYTYPLGIGFKNSSILQRFSLEIPSNLKHFHSNPINIAVETGIIGLGLFLFWIGRVIANAFRIRWGADNLHPLAIAIGSAVISWQVAGLVEYNFGDSEVLYISYLLIGLLSAIMTKNNRGKALEQIPTV